MVQQNIFVFNDTIYSNITLYKQFSEQEIREAVRQAGLSTFINSRGMDYVCGENGNAWSGGEKQRISIVRALLRKSSVLLMDEATAALDEKVLKQYDKIIVLHNGKIEECDTFEKLLEKRGYFHSLYTIFQCE